MAVAKPEYVLRQGLTHDPLDKELTTVQHEISVGFLRVFRNKMFYCNRRVPSIKLSFLFCNWTKWLAANLTRELLSRLPIASKPNHCNAEEREKPALWKEVVETIADPPCVHDAKENRDERNSRTNKGIFPRGFLRVTHDGQSESGPTRKTGGKSVFRILHPLPFYAAALATT